MERSFSAPGTPFLFPKEPPVVALLCSSRGNFCMYRLDICMYVHASTSSLSVKDFFNTIVTLFYTDFLLVGLRDYVIPLYIGLPVVFSFYEY